MSDKELPPSIMEQDLTDDELTIFYHEPLLILHDESPRICKEKLSKLVFNVINALIKNHPSEDWDKC